MALRSHTACHMPLLFWFCASSAAYPPNVIGDHTNWHKILVPISNHSCSRLRGLLLGAGELCLLGGGGFYFLLRKRPPPKRIVTSFLEDIFRCFSPLGDKTEGATFIVYRDLEPSSLVALLKTPPTTDASLLLSPICCSTLPPTDYRLVTFWWTHHLPWAPITPTRSWRGHHPST